MRQTVHSLLLDAARRDGRTAIRHRRGLRVEAWSYSRLRTAAFRFARELEARDVGRGDRVLLRAPNSPEWAAALFGCLLRGAIVVPLDAQSLPELGRRVQQQVEAKLLLDTAARTDALLGSRARLVVEDLERIVAAHDDTPYPGVPVGPDDLVEIVFTSGTTDEPKGVCISHRNILSNLAPVEEKGHRFFRFARLFCPIRFLSPLPFSHLFGQFMGIFVPEVLGAEVFLMDSAKPSELLGTVRREGIAILAGVPRQLEMLREAVEREARARRGAAAFAAALSTAEGQPLWRRALAFRDVHRALGWRFWMLVSGAATLPAETETFWRRLGFVLVQGYGLTEATSLVTANHPLRVAPGTIGKPFPGQEVKVDASGEILVRGPNVSPGYWQEGVRPLVDADGWLHTGDLAENGEDGALRFRDRAKDVIVTAAGTNVYPADLEAALLRQPEVAAATVVGLDGPRGPEPVAVLVLRESGGDAAAVVRRVNEALEPHERIRRFCLWPEADLPRTAATGKVRKREVAEAVPSLLAGQAPGRDRWTPLFEAVVSVGGEVPERPDPDADLTTGLKLDSLGRVELLSALEDRYQVELDEEAFTAATTLGDVQRMLAQGPRESGPAYPYPEWALRFPATWLRRALLFLLVLPLTRLLCWPRAVGRERLSGLRGPVLMVSNHVTMVDQAVILSALPSSRRHRLAIAMDGERLRDWRCPPAGTPGPARLWQRALYGFTVAAFNVFSLPKRSGFRGSLAYAGRALDRGFDVLVFPEGERTRDGRLAPFLPGIGLMVRELGAPVVPIRIDGLFELKRQRRFFARPGRVTVTFGEPLRFEGEDASLPTKVADALAKRVAAT